MTVFSNQAIKCLHTPVRGFKIRQWTFYVFNIISSTSCAVQLLNQQIWCISHLQRNTSEAWWWQHHALNSFKYHSVFMQPLQALIMKLEMKTDFTFSASHRVQADVQINVKNCFIREKLNIWHQRAELILTENLLGHLKRSSQSENWFPLQLVLPRNVETLLKSHV